MNRSSGLSFFFISMIYWIKVSSKKNYMWIILSLHFQKSHSSGYITGTQSHHHQFCDRAPCPYYVALLIFHDTGQPKSFSANTADTDRHLSSPHQKIPEDVSVPSIYNSLSHFRLVRPHLWPAVLSIRTSGKRLCQVPRLRYDALTVATALVLLGDLVI